MVSLEKKKIKFSEFKKEFQALIESYHGRKILDFESHNALFMAFHRSLCQMFDRLFLGIKLESRIDFRYELTIKDNVLFVAFDQGVLDYISVLIDDTLSFHQYRQEMEEILYME